MTDSDSKSGNNQSSKSIRKSIEAQIERAKEDRRREMFRRRTDIAKTGVKHFKARRYIDAAGSFLTYINILEDWKAVPEGGLAPHHFDLKKDLPELLLISGVYWDLVTLYDRARKKEHHEKFMHYLEKFIQFSTGMPHHVLSGETLRKFIAYGNPRHPKELKQAYQTLTGSKCFIATELMEHVDEDAYLGLRKWRDERLKKSILGKMFVTIYEQTAPSIAVVLRLAPAKLRRAAGQGITKVGKLVQNRPSS